MTNPGFKLIFLIFPMFFFTSSYCQKNDISLLGTQIKPIIWGADDLSTKQNLVDFQSGKREPHPLDIGKSLIYTAYKYQQTGDSSYIKQSMGYLALVRELYGNPKYYAENTFKYNFSHGKLKAGWWSGMANSAIIFGLTFCDNVYGTDHQSIIDALIKNLKTDYRTGGSLYQIDENKYWILEYAWPGISEKSAKYVLNGFMYSLICLKMANDILSNPDLEMLFNKGLSGLKHKINEYYFEGVQWTKYDLNPTIEPPHYAIFDIILLESLTSFTDKKEDWIKEISKRKNILKQTYKIDIVKSDEGMYKMLFSLVGPPHPYWIDIYPIKMEINYLDETHKVINSYPPKDFEMDIYKRGFISMDIDKSEFSRIKNIKIISEYLGQEQHLFTYTKIDLEEDIEANKQQSVVKLKALSANYDGVYEDSIIKISPIRRYDDSDSYKNNVAQIVIPFEKVQYLNEFERLAIKVNNSIGISDHKIFSHLEDGTVNQQYYRQVTKGDNILVFKPINIDKGLKKIVWQIYTSKLTEDAVIKIEDIFKINSEMELEGLRSVSGEKPQKINPKPIMAKFDAELNGSLIRIDSKKLYNDEIDNYRSKIAQIVIPFYETRYFQENENLVLKIKNNLEIVNHKFFIYDQDGEVYQRYYIPIPKGKNIIILNSLGFRDYIRDKGITRLAWQIYTDNLGEGQIEIIDILKTENNFQLKNVFSDSEYNFEEKIIRGNIY